LRVNLAGARFSWASNLQNLAAGHMTEISKGEWERRVREVGWSGTVRIDGARAYLSNGPTANICGGEIP